MAESGDTTHVLEVHVHRGKGFYGQGLRTVVLEAHFDGQARRSAPVTGLPAPELGATFAWRRTPQEMRTLEARGEEAARASRLSLSRRAGIDVAAVPGTGTVRGRRRAPNRRSPPLRPRPTSPPSPPSRSAPA